VTERVLCDVCRQDWTESPESGGFVFVGELYCPHCAADGLAAIVAFGEESAISSRCPAGQSFAAFARAHRARGTVVQLVEHRAVRRRIG
jgi:hypothetical protein